MTFLKSRIKYVSLKRLEQLPFICFPERTDIAKMFKIIIYTVLSLLMFQRISCDADPHLCQQHVAVNYTEMVAKPMEEYGNFAKYFSELGIQAGNKTVVSCKH